MCGERGCACSAERFYRQPRTTRNNASLGRSLRVFFLEGHSGPMNDMIATLRGQMGATTETIDGMLLAQAEQKRGFIDVFSKRLKTAPPTAYPEKCRGRLLGYA